MRRIRKHNKVKQRYSKGFTLFELSIVLVILGILSAILFPITIHAKPDENVIRFKKGNSTLFKIISELANSDRYYLAGDLGKKPNGNNVTETDYFCKTLADAFTTKAVNCATTTPATPASANSKVILESAITTGKTIEEEIDALCEERKSNIINYIKLPDGITNFEANPQDPFGAVASPKVGCNDAYDNMYYTIWNQEGTGDCKYFETGFYQAYKTICMDIDELDNGEGPFGYGLRVDGKLILGKKAKDWVERKITNKY